MLVVVIVVLAWILALAWPRLTGAERLMRLAVVAIMVANVRRGRVGRRLIAVRTNERAVMLGPRRMGLFTWWCILDQRVSMWTSLVGPVAVALVAILKAPIALPLYAIWIIATRYLQALMLYAVRRDVTAWWPPLLYFNQIYGSMIKVFVLFHLDKQKWTRQNTVGKRDLTAWRERINKWSSRYAMVTFVMVFIMLIANLVDALPVVDGKLAGSVIHLLTAGAV